MKDELGLMFHGSSVRTQKDPLRDSDLLVLTVCCYRRKNVEFEKGKGEKKNKGLGFSFS